ncbi:MAG: hypothetical protein R2716_11670 [Microthrixaceae bacterium]
MPDSPEVAIAVEINRVLDRSPVPDLDAYVGSGGGEALALAGRRGPIPAVISAIHDAEAEGQGGADSTATKWATVAPRVRERRDRRRGEHDRGRTGDLQRTTSCSGATPTGCWSALVAARVVGAGSVKVGISKLRREIQRLQAALTEISDAGLSGTEISLVLGPSSYLFGEETALLGSSRDAG